MAKILSELKDAIILTYFEAHIYSLHLNAL